MLIAPTIMNLKPSVCIAAVTSIGFVAADQEQPYGDILLTPGSMYSLGSTC